MKFRKKIVKYTDGGMVRAVKGEPVKPPKKSDLDSFMEYVINKKGGKAEDYINLQNAIAFHETGAQQRMRPDAVQLINVDGKLVPQGVGRGMFMFESGEKAGGITAVNRTYKEYTDAGMTPPSWLSDLYKEKSLDASKLTEDQQRILFLGNYLQHPKANLGDVVSGKQSIEDFWGKYHHAGGETNYNAFRESYKAYTTK